MRTVWGYDVNSDIAPIITTDKFNELTNNAYSGNARAEAAIKAASQAIRNFCGWHITPELECTAHPVSGGNMLKLQAAYVSNVTSVTEDGEIVEDYEWRKDGLIRRKCGKHWTDSWDGIEVVYAAGYDADAVPDLVEAVCSIAAGVLAVSPGVVSESADGVAISYSANASSIAAALTSQQKSALDPYKVVSSHAA